MATATATPANPTAPATAGETVLFTQSYSFKIPKNMDGVQEIFADASGTVNEKALVYALRAGIKQIVNNRVRQKFTEKDDKGNPAFAVQEGIFDATSLLLDAPQRQVLSQRDKLEKNLKTAGLPEAVITSMLSTYDTNVGTAVDEGGNTSVDTSEARVILGGKEGKQLVMKVGSSSDEDEEEAA
jgi:hypothetical protein